MPKAKTSQIIETPVDLVRKRFPCRDEVISGLERLLVTIKWPFILIDGPHSTGKTCITRALLEALGLSFSWNNCLEIGSLKSLQSKIMYDIDFTVNPNLASSERVKSRVTSNETFIIGFTDLLENLTAKSSKIKVLRTPKKTPTKSASKRSKSVDANATYSFEPKSYRYFVVLDNYDKLVDSSINILPALNQVHEAMRNKVQLITIMITTLYADRFLYNFFGVPKPIVFNFPSFDLKSLPQVLSRVVCEDRDEKYYRFSEIVCSTLSASIGDLNKLSTICKNSFMDHIDEITSRGLNEDESNKQLRKFFLEKVESYVKSAISHGGSSSSVINSLTMKELPKSTKYLLIAAFLASYNSKSTDRKFFVVASDKRKVSRSMSRKEQTAIAPKLFPLERLLHIYESLIYLNEAGNHCLRETLLNQPINQLLSQIETLVNLKLLMKVNSVTISPLSSLIKYQISDFVTYEFIESLAKSITLVLAGHMSC